MLLGTDLPYGPRACVSLISSNPSTGGSEAASEEATKAAGLRRLASQRGAAREPLRHLAP